MPPVMEAVKRILLFVSSNFGPLIVFYGANHFYGLRNAILISIVFSIADIGYKLFRKQPLTGFFLFSVLVTLVFGSLDLLIKDSIFFRYEAAITNIITGIYFGLTIWSSKSLIQEFVEKKIGKPVTDLNAILRLRMITVVWTIYFFIKAGWYVFLSAHYSIEEALLIRTTVGSVSFYALLAISIIYGKKILSFFQERGFLPRYPEVISDLPQKE